MTRVAALVAWLLAAASAAAQSLPPAEPVTFGDGRVVISGDVAASTAPPDEGFFNYGSYEQSTVRQLRLGVSGLVRLTDRVSVLGELRSENLGAVTAVALFARIRPFAGRRFDLQVGRIPPTFGAFGRRAYSRDNPLIGVPLAYQYLTSLRADALAANADELLRMRGRGWLSNYSVGNLEPAPGVPLVNGLVWDTGVQVTTGWNIVTIAAAITNGTMSNPRISDDNAGKQLAVRVSATPATGLVIGTSFAQGEFLNRRVQMLIDANSSEASTPDSTEASTPYTHSVDSGYAPYASGVGGGYSSYAHRVVDGEYTQRAHGADVEYSRDHWIVRAESVLSTWQMPLLSGGRNPTPLKAIATSVEGRYTFAPGLYGAARVEYLSFSRLAGATRADEWDAPVTRLEVGGGYYVRRNVLARASVQSNERNGGRVLSSRFLTGQVLYWF
jgi:hypothetical protein